jgi:tripartite-type tricarboxylate transporter receptor subunit TctC
MFIGVSHTLGVKNLGELIELARKKPNDIAYATTGRGRFTHLTMEKLQQRAGIQLRLVTYAGGPTAALPDVVSGRVGIVIEGYSGVASAMQGNIIQSLAVATPERLPGFEQLSTIAETLPGFSASGWSVLVAPKGVPAPIIAKVAGDLSRALDNKELNARYNALGAFTRHMTPEETAAFTRSEQTSWRPILEKVAQEEP